MILERFFTPGLAQVAYGVGDAAAGVAAIIDPRRDIAVYTDWAAAHGVRIAAILETHVHADFVSGARELAAATGAPVYASRLGEQAFPHEPLDDGDEVAIGQVRLRALWTPGHTPEHLAYLLVNPAQGPEPVALFSGDALFVGEVGRPDLMGEEQTRHLAGQLFHTVMDRLGRLDDRVFVYPGHTAGSACGKKIGEMPQTTIGQEKRFNYAFQVRDKRAFVEMVLADMPKAPTYYPLLKRVNKAGAALLTDQPPGQGLAPEQVVARQAAGALVVDARSPAAFGEGHVPDAVFAGLGPNFTAWMGWLAPYDRDLILVLERDEQFAEALVELHRIGLDRVAGFLDGGMAAWCAAGRPLAALPQVAVHELAGQLAGGAGPVVLDVRGEEEWRQSHIAGTVHRYVGDMAQGALPGIDPSSPITVICGSGYRSSVAASLLQRHGYERLVNVTGGMGAWEEAGLPTTAPGDDETNGTAPEVGVDHAAQAREAGEAQLVDVREPEEWLAGHIPGAVLIPLDQLAARAEELEQSRPVIAVCRSGRRSLVAANILIEAGFADAASLAGGMLAWGEAGQPLETGR